MRELSWGLSCTGAIMRAIPGVILGAVVPSPWPFAIHTKLFLSNALTIPFTFLHIIENISPSHNPSHHCNRLNLRPVSQTSQLAPCHNLTEGAIFVIHTKLIFSAIPWPIPFKFLQKIENISPIYNPGQHCNWLSPQPVLQKKMLYHNNGSLSNFKYSKMAASFSGHFWA